MNLLSVNVARSIWLFPIYDLNPRGKSVYRTLFPHLAERYLFSKYPTRIEDFDEQKGIKFEYGSFYGRTGDPVTLNATIYADGLIAETRSTTDDGDAFLSEALDAACQEYGLTPMSRLPIRKMYLSEVHVQTQQSLNLLNDKLRDFSRLLSAEVPGFGEQAWETAGIIFSADQSIQAKPAPFRLERAANVASAENRYYSIAPLQTEKHLELLEDLEKILRDDF